MKSALVRQCMAKSAQPTQQNSAVLPGPWQGGRWLNEVMKVLPDVISYK